MIPCGLSCVLAESNKTSLTSAGGTVEASGSDGVIAIRHERLGTVPGEINLLYLDSVLMDSPAASFSDFN